MNSIIPSNNSPLQHALAKLSERELLDLNIRVMADSKNADVCDEKWLPFLAWENSIADEEGWAFAENDVAQRNLIKNYIIIHQGKGTPTVIRQLFRDLQLGEIDIIERAADRKYNGEIGFDGKSVFGGERGDWAYYGIVLKRVIAVRQAEILRKILNEIAPARCKLLYLDFRSQAMLWGGEILFDGEFTFGAA